MPRKLRVQYPAAIYQAMNRGDRREAIFLDDQDQLLLLGTLGEACRENRLADSRLVSDEKLFLFGQTWLGLPSICR